MSCSCRLSVLLVLLLAPVSPAQSGHGDADSGPRIRCTADIMTDGSSLTCTLVAGGSDDEDEDEDDGIKKMTACYDDFMTGRPKCVRGAGDTISSSDLNLVVNLNVTIHFKRRGAMTKMIDLQKIVKPRSPQVWNVTVQSDQVLVYIRTPYHNEYLKVENQLFQLLIWSAGHRMTQNISSSNQILMKINMDRLQRDAQYQVKVRSIPQGHLQGSWSEWSAAVGFFTPAEVQNQPEDTQTSALVVCLVLLAAVTSSAVLLWKNKIMDYMWPSVPHPKHTLVQICRPNKGLLLDFKPEVFSALKVDPMETTEEKLCEEPEPSVPLEPNPPGSSQSSDSSMSPDSVSTDELELSALLGDQDSLRSAGPVPEPEPEPEHEAEPEPEPEPSSEGDKVEVFGNQQEEAYVTMSSFYQIK